MRAEEFYQKKTAKGRYKGVKARLNRGIVSPGSRSNIELEALGIGDYYGFELDGDHLFLFRGFDDHSQHIRREDNSNSSITNRRSTKR